MRIFVETERLILREMVVSDARGLFELDADPEVHRYLGNHPVTELAQSVATIGHVRAQYQKNGIGRWAIIDKKSQVFLGWAGLKWEEQVRKNLSYVDLGYRLKRRYWGRGFATEAAAASLQYGFDTLGYKEICAATHVENKASQAILQKLGFRQVESFRYDGALHHWYCLQRESFGFGVSG